VDVLTTPVAAVVVPEELAEMVLVMIGPVVLLVAPVE
jgi:hypothetical protein